MAYDYYIDHVDNIVVATFSGRVSGEEVCNAIKTTFTDPNRDNAWPHVWDASQITSVDLSLEDLERLKSTIKEYVYPDNLIEAKIAVVLKSRIAYAFYTMIRAFFKWKAPTRLFSDTRSAMVWIHLPPTEERTQLIDKKGA